MVIGGYSYGPVEFTYFYDLNEGEWINGPSLMQGRYGHAAGIFTDEETGEHFVAVTGGLNFGNLDSTEILQEGEWIQGKICNTYHMLSFGKLSGRKIQLHYELLLKCFAIHM